MPPHTYDTRDNSRAVASIGEMMQAGSRARANAALQSGEAQARAAQQSGNAWAGAVGSIGQMIGAIPGELQQQKRMAQQDQMGAMQLRQMQGQDAAAQREAAEDQALRSIFSEGEPPPEAIYRVVGPQRGAAILKGMAALKSENQKAYDSTQTIVRDVVDGLAAAPEGLRASAWTGTRQNLITRGIIKPEDAPEQYDPTWFEQARSYGRQPKDTAPKLGERDPTKDIWNTQTGEIVTKGTPKAEPRETNVTEAQLAAMAARGDPAAGKALQLLRGQREKAGGGAAEPLHAIMGPEGKPILVPRSQAVGKQPASSREQGRAVTSGDAGRIAELDTSLNDLDTLGKQLGTTGAASKVGALLPNVVTEVTGWGSDAKQRQGTIDRVKQVIGKALEGGVLRKEDEQKYTKILPTIGDPPEVAATKLDGLKKALVQRRQTTIEALADAGYDTAKFEARTSTPAPDTKPKADPLGLFK